MAALHIKNTKKIHIGLCLIQFNFIPRLVQSTLSSGVFIPEQATNSLLTQGNLEQDQVAGWVKGEEKGRWTNTL